MVQEVRELFATDKGDKIKHWTIHVEGNEIVVRHGRFNGKMQEKRTTCKGKNLGKTNETTDEQQALLEADSKYNKQIDKLYRPTIEEASTVGQVLPMLAKNYLDSGHRIQFPCYVSPKLDGVRCIATLDREGNVTLNSRGGKTYECPNHIRKELVSLWQQTGVNKFDGELYIHGLPLQDIVSAVKKPNENTGKLVYHVFDIPSDKPWEKRLADLNNVNDHWSNPNSIEIVPNSEVASEKDAEYELYKWIKRGFEGIMLRNKGGMYEYNHRSADLQKWKLMQDLEAKVVDVSPDKLGEGVLICEFGKIQFACKMKGTHESRLQSEMEKLVGKWITVKYQTLTKDEVPQFPVGLCVRECDEEGNPNE